MKPITKFDVSFRGFREDVKKLEADVKLFDTSFPSFERALTKKKKPFWKKLTNLLS